MFWCSEAIGKRHMHKRFERKTLLVTAVMALASLEPVAAQTRPMVTIDTGAIVGLASDDVLIFKGIPYAGPPLGEFRWRAPQPVEPWTGVRDATEPGHDCMQIPYDDIVAPPGTTPSEDCLVLTSGGRQRRPPTRCR
jgi:para-nitrobenzyl esterase